MRMVNKIAGSFRLLLLTYLGVVLACGLAFSVAEGVDLHKSIYWAGVTATSVGFGDITPKTMLGQLLANFLAHSTVIILTPLITANLAAKAIVDSDAWTHEEQEEIKILLREIRNGQKQLAP